MDNLLRSLVCATLALIVAAPALAQDKQAAREREALRRVQQMNQSLASDKRRLEQEREELAGKNKAVERDLKKAKSQADSVQAELDRTAKDKADLSARLEDLEKRHQDVSAKEQASEKALQESQALAKRLEGRLAEQLQIIARQAQAMQVLEDKNAKLYRLGADLLERYRQVGVADVLLKDEPLTGIKQVESDNVFVEYRDKLGAQRADRP